MQQRQGLSEGEFYSYVKPIDQSLSKPIASALIAPPANYVMNQVSSSLENNHHQGTLDWLWDIDDTVQYIEGGGHTVVALQFPDSFLFASTSVAQRLQRRLGHGRKVYVLADTAYNPLAVDEVAAHHIGATCVVHYGWASLTPVSQLPAFFVFPKAPLLQVEEAAQQLVSALAASAAKQHKAVVLVIDQEYSHVRQQLMLAVQQRVRDHPDIPHTLFSDPPVTALEPAGPRTASPPAPGTAGCASPSASTGKRPPACCTTGCGAADRCLPAPSTPSSTGGTASSTGGTGVLLEGCSSAAPAEGGLPEGRGHQASPPTRCTAQYQGECRSAAAPAGGCCLSEAASLQGCQQASASVPHERAAAEALPEAAAAAEALPEAAAAPGVLPEAAVSGTLQAGPCSAPTCHDTASASVATTELPAAGPRRRRAGCAAGVTWELPEPLEERDCFMVWFGSSQAPALQLLQLAYNSSAWMCCEPQRASDEREGAGARLVVTEGLAPSTQALLRRRYFLVEKAKQASIVGVLAGTLAAAGFRDAISLVRSVAHAAGKKTYTFVMGKPNPAKLANFPEVEVWVMVADPLGFMLDCKEYLAPILSPHEAVLAFRGLSLEPGARYPLDFNEVVQEERERCLREGAWRGPGGGQAEEEEGGQLTLLHIGSRQLTHGSAGSGRQLAARDAAEYLAVHRQYKGLETPLTGAQKVQPSALVSGRTGRAAGYDDEPSVCVTTMAQLQVAEICSSKLTE